LRLRDRGRVGRAGALAIRAAFSGNGDVLARTSRPASARIT
jgi:hypothetical protein